MMQTRYEFGDDLYSQVRWGDATLLPPGEGACPPLVEGGGEGVSSFFLYDGLGSTRSLTNASGAIVQSYNYRPFGDFIEEPQNLSTHHLFTGEYFDKDLDYYYLRARYYSPGLGRFTGYDPVEDANNKLHKYAYCASNPLNYLDASGTSSFGELLVTVAIIGILGLITFYNTWAFNNAAMSWKPNEGRLFDAFVLGFMVEPMARVPATGGLFGVGLTLGIDVVYIRQMRRWYEFWYAGGTLGTFGRGIGVKVGLAWNVLSPEDYAGFTSSSNLANANQLRGLLYSTNPTVLDKIAILWTRLSRGSGKVNGASIWHSPFSKAGNGKRPFGANYFRSFVSVGPQPKSFFMSRRDYTNILYGGFEPVSHIIPAGWGASASGTIAQRNDAGVFASFLNKHVNPENWNLEDGGILGDIEGKFADAVAAFINPSI